MSSQVVRTFFDFHVPNYDPSTGSTEVSGDEILGRVIFELWPSLVPRTVESFRALSTGERGISRLSQLPLHYKGSIIHRVIDGFMVQGGDFTKKTGAGGESIYGGSFADEEKGLQIPIDREGLLVMANKGKNTNGSQWFVTLGEAPHLNGKHVVFGKVVKGLEVIQAIGRLPTDEKDRPLRPVTIVNCGELVRVAKPKTQDEGAAPVSNSNDSRRKARRSRSSSGSDSNSESNSDDSDDSRDLSRSQSRSRSHRKSKSHKRSKYSDVSETDSDSDGSNRDRRQSKKRSSRKTSHHHEKKGKRDGGQEAEKGQRKETEEELDARLEREENERLEAARLAKLEEMKKQLEAEREKQKSAGGVVYKGRGAMRYLDPETTRQRPFGAGHHATAMDSRSSYSRRGAPQPRPYERRGDPRDRSSPRNDDRPSRDLRDRLGLGLDYGSRTSSGADRGIDGDWREARKSAGARHGSTMRFEKEEVLRPKLGLAADTDGREDVDGRGGKESEKKRERSLSPVRRGESRSPSPGPRQVSDRSPARGEARSESPMQRDD